MAQKTSKGATGSAGPVPGMEAITEWQQKGLDAMASFGTAWVEQMNEAGAEMLSFMADRVSQDIAFQQQVLQCKDPVALNKLQAEYIRTAMEQYRAETGKMVEISQSLIDAAMPKS